MLSVAGADSCRQCSFAHREWALAEGLPEAELAALEGLDAESFDARTWAAIAWAQAYARSDFADVPDAIDANFRQHFSAQERADIELVARTMYWLNETSNGVRRRAETREGRSSAGKHRAPRARGAVAVRRRSARRARRVRRQAATQPDLVDPRASGRSSASSRARGPDTISGPGELFGGNST